MDGYPFFAVCIGLPLAMLGVTILVLSAILRKQAVEIGKVMAVLIAGAIIFSAGIAAFILQWYLYYAEYESMRHVELDYDVTLELEGDGQVRVLLPLPVSEAIYEDLLVFPPSTTHSIYGSGNQSRLDINMTGNTTIHGMLSGLWSDIKVGMTWTSPESHDCWSSNCTSRILVEVISGSVTRVRVQLRADWSSPCRGYTWEMDVEATLGDVDYPGEWVHMVC